MNPTPAQTSSRSLRPVARHFDKEGAAVLPLSPSRGVRNASIIYEKIKDLPGETVIRADYDRVGKPYLYFPRSTKMSKQTARDLLSKANIVADRQEALNIMLMIARDVQDKSDISPDARLAAMKFGLVVRQRNMLGDIHVSDVRDALATINGVERSEKGGQALRQKGALLRAQLANFIRMPEHLKAMLATTLETGRGFGDTGSSLALDAMFKLVKDFLDEHPGGDARAFLSHVGHYPLSRSLIRFAWQWRKFKEERNTTMGLLFRQMAWVKQIDFAARVIKFMAQRFGRWKDPAQMSESGSLPSLPSLASLDSFTAGPGLSYSQITPAVALNEEESSDVQVMSSPAPREMSRARPLHSPRSESSDVRISSSARDEADVAVSSTESHVPTSLAGRPLLRMGGATDDRISRASLQSLLANVEWIPLNDSETSSDPNG